MMAFTAKAATLPQPAKYWNDAQNLQTPDGADWEGTGSGDDGDDDGWAILAFEFSRPV